MSDSAGPSLYLGYTGVNSLTGMGIWAGEMWDAGCETQDEGCGMRDAVSRMKDVG